VHRLVAARETCGTNLGPGSHDPAVMKNGFFNTIRYVCTHSNYNGNNHTPNRVEWPTSPMQCHWMLDLLTRVWCCVCVCVCVCVGLSLLVCLRCTPLPSRRDDWHRGTPTFLSGTQRFRNTSRGAGGATDAGSSTRGGGGGGGAGAGVRASAYPPRQQRKQQRQRPRRKTKANQTPRHAAAGKRRSSPRAA